jgi:hypothetical protein
MRIEQRDLGNPEHSLSLPSTHIVEKCNKNLIIVDDKLALGGNVKCPIINGVVHIDSLGLCNQENCSNQYFPKK